HGFQQWRPRRELDPLDADLPPGKPLLEHGPLPRDHQHAGLLVTNPDFLDGGLRTHLPGQRRRRRYAKRQFKEVTTLHHNLLNDRPVVRCDAGMMMMMLLTSVECSAKIAMTTLCAWDDATGLLPDIEPPRRIFLWLRGMHIFRSHPLKLRNVVIEAAMV